MQTGSYRVIEFPWSHFRFARHPPKSAISSYRVLTLPVRMGS
jgi:hypothetical protein